MALRHAAMLEVNEFLVLDLIRDRAETTRPDIAHALGLSASSVSRIVARLIREGMVTESGPEPTSGGRPRSRIAFNPRAGALIAIDLGGTRCRGALADLAGEVLLEDERASGEGTDAFETLLAVIRFLADASAERRLPVAAVAVGIPAILDPVSGRAVAGPRVHWRDFEIMSRLSAELDVPFLVENDVNLAALAHAWRGEARGIDDFVVVSVGTGIGGAVVADGRLVKGHHNAGGEVGYITVDRDQLDAPVELGLGGLEAVASGPAIARLAGRGTAGNVFKAAAEGDPLARKVVDEAVDRLSIALTAIAATVDPEIVILEGSIGRSLEPYLDLLRARLANRLPSPPSAVVSTLASATVVGAIAAAMQLARERRAPGALTGTFRSGPWTASTATIMEPGVGAVR
ncbi:MAG TPA: ROK family transcriptional regulator [Candidatus Limnocylindrales bacterium]